MSRPIIRSVTPALLGISNGYGGIDELHEERSVTISGDFDNAFTSSRIQCTLTLPPSLKASTASLVATESSNDNESTILVLDPPLPIQLHLFARSR